MSERGKAGSGPAIEGLLLVNKPSGMTSHDVVDVVRRAFHLRRVGHTGTLDPMAEGLLIVLVGAATKHQRELQASEKVYEAVLRLGARTDTADADGQVVATAPVPVLEAGRVAEVLASFQGELSQTPPAYSAVKVKGRPAYWWARRNTPVPLSARTVQLTEVALLGCTADTIRFRVRCSAGTYVRTLAEMIAERLGTLGHLAALVRLRIGAWDVAHAKSVAWIQTATSEALSREVIPVPGAGGAAG